MAQLIVVTYGGRASRVLLGKDVAQFRGNIAAEFDLLSVDVTGFARGGVIFPFTYVLKASKEFLLSTQERPLEVVVFGIHHRVFTTVSPNQDRENDPIISFPLSNSDKPITVTRKEMELLNFVRTKTGLAKINLSDLRNVFSKYSRSGTLSKRSFDMIARELIGENTLTDMEKKVLSGALTRIFFAFDRDGDGVVVGPELYIAMGTLVSSKGLNFAFRLADANGDGYISPQEMLVFTRAFLTLVLALNDDVADYSADFVCMLIDSTTESVTRKAFHEADSNHDGLLTWSEFSTWFKTGGHMVMPWVSLLQSHSSSDFGDEEDEAVDLGAQSSDIVYEFNLAPTFGSLAITKADVENLEHLVRCTGLFQKDPERTVEFIYNHTDRDGTLSKEMFDACIQSLCPSLSSLPQDDLNQVVYMLNNVFFSFDRTGGRRVRADEFCTGFSLLCAGSKSSKLQLSFGLFDAEDQGSIRPLDFARFLRSVLTMLFALNEAATSQASFQVYEAIDRTTARATRVMLKNLTDVSRTPPRVSFEDFAVFYNTQSGNEMISFVELLDLSKFPFQQLSSSVARSRAGESQPQRQQQASRARNTQQADEEEEVDDRVVFSFDMLPAPARLEVKLSDSNRLRRVLDITNFESQPPERLFSIVSRGASPRRTITKQEYDRIISQFVANPENASSDDRLLRSYFFNSLFYAFDRDGSNEDVSSKELACGLSILCSGKKSDKLAFGFASFDSDDDGLLSLEELARFMRSFITALFVFVQTSEDQDPNQIWQIVDTTSLALARDVMGYARSNGGRLSFEDFAQWYGEGGFKQASFLELLDLGKWPFPPSTGSQDGVEEDDWEDDEEEDEDYAPSYPDDTEDEAFDPSMAPRAVQTGEDAPVFVFNLTKHITLEVEQGDIEFVQQIVLASGINYCTPDDLISAFTHGADELKVLHESEFNEALASICQQGADANSRDFAKEAFGTLYEMCDRDGLGCDFRDLLGLMFLCSGSKSTKLAHCWNAVDTDHDGELTRSELYNLLRAFLSLLFAFNYGANTSPMDEVHRQVDSSSSVLAANIFLSARRKRKDTISFEEFAEFYSEGGGYRLAPWLELLNLSKFIGAEYDKSSTSNGVNQTKNGKSRSSANANADGDNKVIFAFKITEDNDTLVVTMNDIKFLRSILSQSKIGSIDPEPLMSLIHEQMDSAGHLTEQGFGTFVGSHVLYGSDTTQDEFVASALYRLFAAYDWNGDGYVQPIPFAIGLSLLAAGAKSAKLSLAWALYSPKPPGMENDSLTVGPLNQLLLTEFFVALLTAVSFFAGNCLDERVIHLAAAEAADQVFNDLGGDEVTFDGFASWYTSKGFEHLSWIELLASSKWKATVDQHPQASTSAHLVSDKSHL
jgi:Ca2+-binding EF-hand superfamily protein